MATRTITTRIALDGEKEFKNQMSQVNSELRTLKSEMALASAEFKGQANTVDALTRKGDILKREYAQQAEKVRALEKAVADSADAYGEADKRTDGYRQQLNHAKAQLLNLNREIEDNDKYLEEASKSSDGAAKSIDGYGKSVENADKKGLNFGAAAKGVATALAGIAAAAAGAAVAVGKEAISAYADFEQLEGGVETLFKDSSGRVMDYATDAYKTAGLSANQYMETVTGFSASLIASVGGDTAVAAEKANQAIIDMSDNANKMGTDIGSIQNAYQGFAKQNYTMLDNLKLGYGGTKQEMERLLADAEKLSGQKYSIDSFSDIVDAIHVVQTELDITGTTAKEAESTISGSIGMLGSAVENWKAGLGNPNADMAKLTRDVTSAFQSVLTNVEPVVKNIVKALPEGLRVAVDALADMTPMLLGTVTDLFNAALDALLELLPELTPTAVNAIMMIASALIDNLDKIIDGGLKIILALTDGILDALPELVSKLPQIILTIVQTLSNNFPQIMAMSGELIKALWDGLKVALPQLIRNVPTIVNAIGDGLGKGVGELFKIGGNLLAGLWNGMANKVDWLKRQVKGVVDKIKGWFTGSDGFDTHSPSKWSEKVAGNVMEGYAIGTDRNQEMAVKASMRAISNIKSGLSGAEISTSIRAAAQIGSQTGSGQTGSGAPGITGGRQIIELHTTVELDRRKVGQSVTRYQINSERAVPV